MPSRAAKRQNFGLPSGPGAIVITANFRSPGSPQISGVAIVLMARYFNSAFDVLTIWCAVSGPPGGCAMTSPFLIGNVSGPIRTSPSPSSTKNISSLTRWLWNGQARLPGGTTVRLQPSFCAPSRRPMSPTCAENFSGAFSAPGKFVP